MKEITFTITVFILLFMGISTILGDSGMVGEIGASFGRLNRDFFGILSYIYPFVLIYPAYKLYNEELEEVENIYIFFVAIIFLVISILTFQGMLFSSQNAGIISSFLYNFFYQYIGAFGTFLFIVSSGFLALQILFEFSLDIQNTKQRFSNLKQKAKENLNLLSYTIKKEPEHELFDLPDDIDEQDFQTLVEKKVKKDEKDEVIDVSFDEIENSLKSTINQKVDEKENQKDENFQEIKKDSLKEQNDDKKDIKSKNSHIPIVKEIKENKKLLATIETGKKADSPKNFKLPKLDFLKTPPKKRRHINEVEIDKKIENLLHKLRQFKIEGDVVATYSGPVVTTFEFKPAAHIKVSKILTLQDDLAMALKAKTIRIQAPIPGKDVVGIEIPNDESETIYLREILETKLFQTASSPLTMAVGKDIVGNPFITDLKKLPHLLIAGTTGSGKSVGINAMLVSLLYRNSPDDLKFLMIDPKMLEFSIYNDIPHLLTPVITQAKQAIMALANMVLEMERRYKLMSKTKTKNIENYNEKAKKEGFEPFPYIVVIIDELADLMMTSGKDVEFYIARLAQMARASGIHLIVATQRPSVDVVTGLIKANLPSRMSFKVGQKIDSKVILDSTGADTLLGRGDMLFTPPGTSSLVRLHAPFVTEEEIEKIVEWLKAQREVVYDESFLSEPNPNGSSAINASPSGGKDSDNSEFDELFDEAKNIVLTEKKTSISYIQRRLQIGYNRSARIIEQLEQAGILSAPNHKGQREILV